MCVCKFLIWNKVINKKGLILTLDKLKTGNPK